MVGEMVGCIGEATLTVLTMFLGSLTSELVYRNCNDIDIGKVIVENFVSLSRTMF